MVEDISGTLVQKLLHLQRQSWLMAHQLPWTRIIII